jgi:hypothetical protein
MLNSDNTTYGNVQQKIMEELESVLGTALTSKEETINKINDIKTVATWYKEAKQHPNEIPSIITNEAISRLLENIGPYLVTFLIDKIKIEIELHSKNMKIKELEINFSVKPFVEYIKKINRVESNKVRVTFNFALSGKVNGITVNSDDMMGRKVDIDSFVASLTVSIINLTVSTLSLPGASLLEPIVLCYGELYKVRDLSFRLPM